MIRPILFSTPMVKAIINGDKRMTRRVMKPQPVLGENGMWEWKDCLWMDGGLGFSQSDIEGYAPFKVSDVLWVREAWARQFGLYWHKAGLEVDENGYCKDGYWTKNAAAPGGKVWIATKAPDKWRPSIHMPKAAARLFLKVTDVRAERLHSISGDLDELEREGMNILFGAFQASMNFAELWDGMVKPADIGMFGWNANPWVWVYTFERCEKPKEFM